ncbi:carboxypeptidase S [Leucogyrophana mollusca]|uniref:Carboxypeptidase S n=1 Tax=Leucogyrophana mollusca TaxID=85980 RepID=A0ACB8BUH4_9AGAM|nr:carboxypeptidase S [Leucogyrophana mollusca]
MHSRSVKAEDDVLPGLGFQAQVHRRRSPHLRGLLSCLALLCLLHLSQGLPSSLCRFRRTCNDIDPSSQTGPLPPSANSSACPQWDATYPTKHARLDADLELLYGTDDFKLNAYKALGGAVQIPSESYDDNEPVGQDPRWEIFAKLHEHLEITFPLVYEKLKVTKVNTYGLVFHWQGSTQAKPILITAHQDVVPVEPSTISQWEHDPYSGYYDGTWIWGRGSCDDKGDLIQQLLSVNALLEGGFAPSRTLVLAYGFDEESAGEQGAAQLAKYLEATYGRDGFAMLLDEGGGIMDLGEGMIVASPSVSEKGYLDVKVEIKTPGGHSSVPPAHTSIGLLSRFITVIEDNPHEPQLLRTGTQFTSIQCLAAYSPSYPEDLRTLAKEATSDDSALQKLKEGLLAVYPLFKAELGTTQAVDLIQGGIKVNALPEQTSAVVNHRIAEHSSVRDLQRHLADLLSPVAAKYDLTLEAFGQIVVTGSAGEVSLSDASYTALEPSPVSPTTYGPYSLLGGSIKAALASSTFYNTSGIIVAPSLSLGNTDTKSYWNLTKHIFRYSPFHESDMYNGAHTVNEARRAESVIEGIRFYTKFILNVDESELL